MRVGRWGMVLAAAFIALMVCAVILTLGAVWAWQWGGIGVVAFVSFLATYGVGESME